MDLKEAKEILDNCRKDDVARYKEAQKVFAGAEEVDDGEGTVGALEIPEAVE